MIITCENRAMYVDIGGFDTWKALCATVSVRLNKMRDSIPLAFRFLSTGKCASADCLETARQFNTVRDLLSKYPPNQLVYDAADLNKKAPWGDKISPVITSCANYLTTGDGRDLLAEIVRILSYSAYTGQAVELE